MPTRGNYSSGRLRLGPAPRTIVLPGKYLGSGGYFHSLYATMRDPLYKTVIVHREALTNDGGASPLRYALSASTRW